MKSAIIATLVGSAAAFAPAPVAKTSSAVNAFEDELGAQPPLGFYDPFGMLNGDVSQERFDQLRDVETKHGRMVHAQDAGELKLSEDNMASSITREKEEDKELLLLNH